MSKNFKGLACPKKSKKMLAVGTHRFIMHLNTAEQRAQAKFILNNYGL